MKIKTCKMFYKMCIICTEEYKNIEGLQILNCFACLDLIKLPVIPGLKKLFCYYCPNLEEIPNIPGLEILACKDCPKLKEIPVIAGLQQLYFNDCPKLEEIPVILGLKSLICYNCQNLKEIPEISGMCEFACIKCRSVVKIPKYLSCKYLGKMYYTLVHFIGTSLFDIHGNRRVISTDFFLINMPWITQNPDYEENLEKLRFLQKKFKRRYTGKKLEALIPQISEIYYSPGCKGYELAKRSFYTCV